MQMSSNKELSALTLGSADEKFDLTFETNFCCTDKPCDSASFSYVLPLITREHMRISSQNVLNIANM